MNLVSFGGSESKRLSRILLKLPFFVFFFGWGLEIYRPDVWIPTTRVKKKHTLSLNSFALCYWRHPGQRLYNRDELWLHCERWSSQTEFWGLVQNVPSHTLCCSLTMCSFYNNPLRIQYIIRTPTYFSLFETRIKSSFGIQYTYADVFFVALHVVSFLSSHSNFPGVVFWVSPVKSHTVLSQANVMVMEWVV